MASLFEAKPFIVAEVGSNFLNYEDCAASIRAAKECGADAVKFQCFSYRSLYGPNAVPPSYYKNPELQVDWLPRLKNVADENSIEFMCTAFDVDTLRQVDQYVGVHKIASSDLAYPDLLKAVASFGKPILLSTGAATRSEISMALAYLRGCRVVLLYCVSAYPAKSVNLFVLDDLKTFNTPVGFSDHTKNIDYIPCEAVKHGAVVIEKHFTCINKDTPDRPHSLNPEEFRMMVLALRGDGKAYIGPTPEERDMLMRHKRRLIATKDIKQEERFSYNDNFGPYRSAEPELSALTPFAWESVDGKIATRPIKMGQAITFLDCK